MKKIILLFILVSLVLFFIGCTLPPVCGNGICEPGETPLNCSTETGGDCPPQDLCGNGVCDFVQGENESNCPSDCLTYHYECIIIDNTPSCEKVEGPGKNDCSPEIGCGTNCGNGNCEGGETSENCPIDCGYCGDGVCGIVESYDTCPKDCFPACGNSTCDPPGEDEFSCPEDCACLPQCVDKECGDDECGGECGVCADGEICNASGLCE